MKKLLIMLMALMLVMLSFTACGGDDNDGGDGGSDSGNGDTGNGGSGDGSGDTGNGGGSTACQHTNTTVTKARVPGNCTVKELTAEITCNDCNQVIQKQREGNRDYTVHGSYTFTAAISPTCTEKGNGPKVQCGLCSEIVDWGEEIPALGHNWVANAEVAATCTRPGSTGGQHCSVCFVENPDNKATVVPAFNHVKGEVDGRTEITEGFTPTPATCTEQGISKKYHCSYCDEDVFEYKPAKNHTEEGVDKFEKDTDFVEVAATCTEKGKSERFVCSLCGAEKFTEIDTVAHVYVDKPEVAATCVAEGRSAGKMCECGDISEGCEVIPVNPDAHGTKEAYGTIVEAANATCTLRECSALGEKCTLCGEVTKEPTYGNYGTTHSADHTEVEIIIKEAACGVAGEKQFKCSGCGDFIKEGTENKKVTIPALECVDEDEDGKCDVCDECMGHVDNLPAAEGSNPAGDGKCDVCDECMGHVDAEPADAVDGKCDVCGEDMPAAEPAA